MASRPENPNPNVSFLEGVQSVNNASFQNCKVIGKQTDLHFKNKESIRPLPLMYDVPPKNAAFVGRGNAMSSISEFINAGLNKGEDSLTPTIYILLHGLGGVGKSSLAQDFTWNLIGSSGSYFEPRIKSAIWLGAGTRDVLVNNYIDLGERQNVLDVEADKEAISVSSAKRVLDWITAQGSTNLFVFDTVQDYAEIKDLVPVRNAVVIFTSRYTENWPNSCHGIPVNCFSTIEALNFMKQIIPEPKYIEADAESLAKTLGYLPLALAYACAYIKKARGQAIKDYLRFYAVRKDRLSLLIKKGLPDYAESVYITWDITMDALSKEAKDWVHICACFYNESVPGFLLQCFINGGYEKKEISEISDIYDIPVLSLEDLEFSLEFYDVQGDLGSYSFASVHTGNQSMTFHNLVQDVCRLKWNPVEARRYLQIATDLIQYVYPAFEGKIESTVRKRTLTSHFKSVVELLQNTKSEFNITIPSDWVWSLTTLLAEAYESSGNPKGTKETIEKLLEMERSKKLEMDGTKKAMAFQLLGNANGYLGFPNKRYEYLLEAVRYIIPPLFNTAYDNVLVSSLRIQLCLNLGTICTVKGDYGKAEKWFYQVLELAKAFIVPRGMKPSDASKSFALINLGVIHSRTGQCQRGLDEIRAGLQVQSQLGYDSAHRWSLQSQLILFNAERRLRGSSPSVDLNSIYEQCLKDEDFESAGTFKMHQGLECQANNNLPDAIQFYEESIAHFKTANKSSSFVDALCHLASSCIASGNLAKIDEVTRILEETLNSFRDTNPDSHEYIVGAEILAHLAAAARVQGQLQKSWENLRESFRRLVDFYSEIWAEQRLIAWVLEGIASTLFKVFTQKDDNFIPGLLDSAFIFEDLALQINENPKTAYVHLYESKEVCVTQNNQNILIYKEIANANTHTPKLPGLKIRTMGDNGGRFTNFLLERLNPLKS